ncbi:hypothetical protein pdam_00021942 [Pocillopora damicornis]|uniref:Uncharacterized protein n=1 Tax=Pocillopora damicornis TaxID=46731 RepID=A0A3M6UWF4_POCDA|nr:hypothetical protein pdam_00021942 [Pocillopora damicornis]
MVRIPSIFTSQGEEVWKLPKERLNKWISAICRKECAEKILDHSLVCEKRLDCGIDTVGPDHPVNVALEVCNTELKDAVAVLDSKYTHCRGRFLTCKD